jgi:hypothetical protein
MPKKKKQSKQDFLKQCVARAVDLGADETAAMADCAAEWNQARMAALVDDATFELSSDVNLEPSEPEGPRRFSVLAYTGKVIDFGWHKFVIDLAGIKMAKDKIPSLLNHDRKQIVGTIDDASTGGSGFVVSGAFSATTAASAEVLGLADEGFPWQASVGIRGLKVLEIASGEKHQVNGQSIEGPADVWLASEVFEVSWCPFGADDDTAAVSMTAEKMKGPDGQGASMHKIMRILLEAFGLQQSATEDEVQAFLDAMDPQAVLAKLADAAVSAERSRIVEILEAEGDQTVSMAAIKDGTPSDSVFKAFFEAEKGRKAEAHKKMLEGLGESAGGTGKQKVEDVQTFETVVAGLMAEGKTRGAATAEAANKYPELHADYVARQQK